jgi:hypothetical protein
MEAHLTQHIYFLGGTVATCFSCYKAIMFYLMIPTQQLGENVTTLPPNK